jgi:Protein of unknown function (DUF2971)
MHQELRALWARAGYTSDMGSAAVTRPPSADFIRVYHITSAQHAISNVALGHLKVARFRDANDPFELMALRFAGGSRDSLKAARTSIDDAVGMLCFSEDWKDPVMWAHYGDKHRGICLGFDLSRELAETISYQDKRLLTALEKAEGDARRLSAAMQRALCTTKFSSWKYEREVRMLVELDYANRSGKLHFLPFNEHLQLAEVILGPQCEQPLDSVRALVKRQCPSAVTFASRLANGHYAVVPKESTVP